jgi:large subunit ribosomal protein L29
MKVSDIREMTEAQIDAQIESAREEMLNLRIQRELGALEDYSRFQELKRDLARMLTIRRERELAAAIVGQAGNQ